MKRSKDDDKAMGPMFPRLHVNDTAEKGGPRAPPRNKMALYEQLSIPSQRFASGSGSVPLNPHNKPSFASSASSSQVSGAERSTVYKNQNQWSKNFPALNSDGTNSQANQFERKKKAGDEDDFTVPVFVQSRVGKGSDNSRRSDDGGNVSSISSALSGQPEELKITSDEALKHTSLMNGNVRQFRDHDSESTKFSGMTQREESFKDARVDLDREYGGHALSDFRRISESEANLHRESRIRAREDSSGQCDDRHNPRSVSCLGEEYDQPIELENDNDCNDDRKSERMCSSVQFENGDKGDDVSETSMVDSASALDITITPDDVVGVIGQKRFWKARKAIVNQQRVFAVQVFELHRLIKVQRLIAGSPHILIEEGVFLGKHLSKSSPPEKVSPEFVSKPAPSASNCKDDSEKPSHKRERYAENAAEKTTLSSAKSGSQSVNHGPYTTQLPQQQQQQKQQPSMVTTSDSQMNPWYFPQPPGGPQWLVPVMSPSEGLVYKPYTGPGVSGPVYGGYGPFGPISMPYGVPNPLTHQPMGVFPGTSPAGPMYFPSYGMTVPSPAMSSSGLEQASHFTGPTAQSQTGPVAEKGANLNAEQQSSCTAPPQRIGPVSQVSKGTSSASSRREIQKGVGIKRNAEGNDPIPVSLSASQPTRVIKVVPHNPRSATESAARIFRIIQEERQQNDAV